MRNLLFLSVMAFIAMPGLTQITPLIEIQGQVDVSPYEGQEVTISGKVTEYFGDSWYMQDAFGAWNGIYVVGPDVNIPANPPYWSAPRQPEVGDVLEITGFVSEVDGNTQINDAVLTNFVDFWNATPMGVWLTASEIADEQYEGTRVRVDNATVLTAPDADGYWTVSDETGSVVCWGIDSYDPSNNEDPDGPTPGDVYQVYGALHQSADGYVLHVGDIDVLSLSVDESVIRGASTLLFYPNPADSQIRFRNGTTINSEWGVTVLVVDMYGRTAATWDLTPSGVYDTSDLSSGIYEVLISARNGSRGERGLAAQGLLLIQR